MIKLIYRIIHYEPSPEHKDNVIRSFYFIGAFILIIPVAVVHLTYLKLPSPSIYKDFTFLFLQIFIVGSVYYLIIVRKAKIFLETEIGKDYYDFGKFNTIFKTMFILLIVGLVGSVVMIIKATIF